MLPSSHFFLSFSYFFIWCILIGSNQSYSEHKLICLFFVLEVRIIVYIWVFINLTAKIEMVMSEVLTMILLHPHMLCQPISRRVCSVALITIKLQILHSQSENRNIINHDCIPQFLSIFSILSWFSFFYWLGCSFIDVHCFFRSVNNLQRYSGCSLPLPPPQSSSAHSPP